MWNCDREGTLRSAYVGYHFATQISVGFALRTTDGIIGPDVPGRFVEPTTLTERSIVLNTVRICGANYRDWTLGADKVLTGH